MSDWQAGLFALPCGTDFAEQFVTGFLQRMADAPPETIARTTIYANSARTLTAIQAAFDRHGPLLLPRLHPVTDLGMGAAAMPGPVAAPLARRLQLARLIDRLLQTRPDLAAGHSVPALAESLAALMTEMQTEGCDADALDTIDSGDHARHWQNALAFLRIAAQFHLTGTLADRAARQRAAAETALADWTEGRNLPDAPVIVAGSTGSHGATRQFIRAVAALPNGAVVLPGFDWHQPTGLWDGLERTEDHPQARYAPLIHEAGYPRPWTDSPAAVPGRNALISLALRPAPVTDQWIAEGPYLPDLAQATEGLTLIEAEQPGQEAEAIALIMREAAERHQAMTLIAADGGLVRRVTTALDRWGLRPDDSAGRALDLTAPGLFLHQISSLFGQAITIDRLLILLKHPLTASGSSLIKRGEARRLARELELRLRARGPVFPDGDTLRDWGSRGDETRKLWAEWLAAILDRLAGFAKDHAPRPLPDRLSDLYAMAGALAAGPGGDAESSGLWQEKPGQMTRAVVDHLAAHAAEGPDMSPADFSALLVAELRAQAVRGDADIHPLLKIRGPREARIVGDELVVLSGLNEGEWPRALTPDPWLSRQMRQQAGLTLPERLIGLSAHDFQQGIAARRVILTRAKRNAEAETVPSRWLNRLTNLLTGLPERDGPQSLAAMRTRGGQWLAMAGALSRPETVDVPAPRPSPIPPAPPFTELPVTDISLLIRDPYAVYAKRVLGLRPLNPLRPEPDAALRGQTLHAIVERLLKAAPPAHLLHATLLQITAQVLEEQVPWPSARAFWQARIEGIARRIVTDEVARLDEGRPQIIEARGAVSLAGMDFRLTAKPDRIDLLNDGRAMIYDYKSGKPPTDKQIASFDKQLVLEAAMARRGGFTVLGPVDVAGIRYIQLGGDGRTQDRAHDAGIENENWEGFVRLIAAYLTGGTGFTAKRAPERMGYAGDYDHLSRFGEWSLADDPKPERVGHDE
ncbi:double-strand break repair protein AddB [Paracoccus sp. (in: a-proteobacteria)]|uniref:double-strand break repair protein AddB n=1 Tax=Paracoccus sp. TaxID=267 RepID=UPI003A88BFF7